MGKGKEEEGERGRRGRVRKEERERGREKVDHNKAGL